jgi:asparagine synthetase B (glutamine-hydrolysing)
MCWFAGGSFSDITTLKSISWSLLRRAKQEPVYYVDSNVSLFHAPLQISDLDLDTNQPYLSSRVVISLVWELYNKEYLLRKIGLSESTQITEVALIEKCYLALWVKFIDYLNGEFVIYLFDKLEAKHYLFRDRYGVHSVYYTTREWKLYFSSHMQDLLSVSSVDNSKINKSGLLEYYTFQFSISPHTVFSDIYIVAPWTFLEFHNGEYKIEKFSEYIPQSKNSNFIDVFEESVIRRIPLHQKKLFIPISWWKDSNLVLYFLQKHFKGEIIPYSFLNTENYMDIESAQKNIKKYWFKHLIIENSEIEQEHFYDNVKLHEWLVKLYNMSWKLRELYPEYDDVHVEFSGDGREELFRVNNHFNCERIKKRYHLLKWRGLISDYNISNDFLNISMFDFNLQLIEKITLWNLIERRLPFTDYELLKFSWSTLYSKEAEKFLKNKWMNIVDGVYGHNTGIYFKYLDNMKEILSYLDTFNYNTSSYDIHKK